MTNFWVVLAVALSMILHCLILYNEFFVGIFATAPLNKAEWTCVIAISFPVIIFDEILKFISRVRTAELLRLKRSNSLSSPLFQFRRLNFEKGTQRSNIAAGA